MKEDITLIEKDYNPETIRKELLDRVEYRIKIEARRMFEYMGTLERNVGKVMRVGCGRPITLSLRSNVWPDKLTYLVGRIGNPVINKERGILKAEGDVFLLDYDFETGGQKRGILQEITNENVVQRFGGFFPFKIWELVHPREFEYSFRHEHARIPIREIKILEADNLLKLLESFYEKSINSL